MNPFDVFLSPIFWVSYFIITCYVSYKMVSDEKWLKGERNKVKMLLSGFGAFASGYVFHASVTSWIIQYHNQILDFIWVLALIGIMLFVYDKLKGTRHFTVWGLYAILFILGMLTASIMGVIL